MLVHCKENNITPGWTICFQREVDIHVLFRINIGKQGCRTWVGMEEVEGISAIDPHTIGPILRPCQTVISVVVTCAVYKVQFKLDWLSPPPLPPLPSPRHRQTGYALDPQYPRSDCSVTQIPGIFDHEVCKIHQYDVFIPGAHDESCHRNSLLPRTGQHVDRAKGGKCFKLQTFILVFQPAASVPQQEIHLNVLLLRGHRQ